jgi:hypothetical protein
MIAKLRRLRFWLRIEVRRRGDDNPPGASVSERHVLAEQKALAIALADMQRERDLWRAKAERLASSSAQKGAAIWSPSNMPERNSACATISISGRE